MPRWTTLDIPAAYWTSLAEPLKAHSSVVRFVDDLDFEPLDILRICVTGETVLLRRKHKTGSWRVRRGVGALRGQEVDASEVIRVSSALAVG